MENALSIYQQVSIKWFIVSLFKYTKNERFVTCDKSKIVSKGVITVILYSIVYQTCF